MAEPTPPPSAFSRRPPTLEDEYFFEHDRDLIRERRAQSDRARAVQKTEHEEAAYWMVCPKCGGEMAEVNLFGVMVEKCASCHGVYLDQKEFQTFVEVLTKSKRRDELWHKISDALTRGDTHWQP